MLKIIPDADGVTEDLDGKELDDAERGVGWLRGPEEAGLEAEEKGSIEAVLCELGGRIGVPSEETGGC